MRAPLPEPLRGGPFAFAEAIEAGLSRRRLREDPELQHPYRGVYLAGEDTDLRARVRALVRVLGPTQWISHLTAARLYGAPMPFASAAHEWLHVTALDGADRVRRPGVHGWDTEDAVPRMVLDGLPLLAPADVWCQLAMPGGLATDQWSRRTAALGEDWLVAVGDFLVTGAGRGQRRQPLCTHEDLRDAAALRRGKRGVRALDAALPRIRVGAHSPQETFLRLGLCRHGLAEPVLQMPVMTSAGLRHADLGYRLPGTDRLLLLEYQGDHHRTDRATWLADLTRVQLFRDAGHETMLVGYADIHPNPAALVARIRRALAR